jgi:hypothetical protein
MRLAGGEFSAFYAVRILGAEIAMELLRIIRRLKLLNDIQAMSGVQANTGVPTLNLQKDYRFFELHFRNHSGAPHWYADTARHRGS